MNRYYYISGNLDVLENVQDELETKGVDPARIHVLTEQDVDASKHHIHEVESLAKKDMVRYGLRGAMVGAGLAALILLIALVLGLMTTIWVVPILFLAAIVLGFCTWEGGLIGAHRPNRDIEKFEEQLHRGEHVLFVDMDESELGQVDQVVSTHPEVSKAGTGKAQPDSVWRTRQSLRNLIRNLP